MSERRSYARLNVPHWKRVEVPAASLRFAKERVAYLHGPAMAEPLEYLLCCAYLQGIKDCVEAHIHNPQLASPTKREGE